MKIITKKSATKVTKKPVKATVKATVKSKPAQSKKSSNSVITKKSVKATVKAAVKPKPVKSAKSPVNELPRAPKWATSFLGKRFNPVKALAAGWQDQGAPNFHYGMPQGKGIWIYKIDTRSEDMCCHHVWWRMVFVKLDQTGKIESIDTDVVEVFSDGHGESMGSFFMPPDQYLAEKALKSATKK